MENTSQMKLCLIVNKGEEALIFEIDDEAVSIGRSNENDIQIQDQYVSRKHLILWQRRNRFLLKNLTNRNGTKVDRHRILRGGIVEVKEGVAIEIGKSVFCIGEGSPEDMFAFLESLDLSKKSGSDATTAFLDTIS